MGKKNVAIMWQRKEKEKSLFLIHKAKACPEGTKELLGKFWETAYD